jgi:hypothetical protein
MTRMESVIAQQSPDVVPQINVRVPTVRVYTDDGSQVISPPSSRAEMQALIAQRQAFTDQVERITERRDNLVDQLHSAPEPAQAGTKAELKLLDQQIIQAQTDLANVERAIARTSNPELISMTVERDEPENVDYGSFGEGMAAGLGAATFFMTALLLFLRSRWRRGGHGRQSLPSADSERLQRLENGVDAMAVEIERISEGQRFVTKLMTESRGAEPAPRLPVGGAT